MKTNRIISQTVLAAIIAAIWTSQPGFAAPLVDGALYHFDGNYTDSVAGGTAATAAGTSALVSASGTYQVGSGAVSTGASSSYVSLDAGSIINGTNNWTMSLWFKGNTGEWWTSAASFGSGSFRLLQGDGVGHWYLENSGLTSNILLTTQVPSDYTGYQFWAFADNGTTFTVYQGWQNGDTWELDTVLSLASTANLNGTSTIYLGATSSTDGNYQATFDEVAIWKEGLNLTDITSVFNAGVSGTDLTAVPEPMSWQLTLLSGVALSLFLNKRLSRKS
jgi:hypothetical protein